MRIAVAVVTSLVATLGFVAQPAQAAVRDGRLAFVRANQIYTVTSTGTGQRKLTSAGQNYRPAWSPDGGRVAYVHEESGRKDVWVMAADGTSKKAVTTGGTVTAAPSWSPDGQWLAFGMAGQVAKVKAVAPFGQPQLLLGWNTNGSGGGGDETPADAHPIGVDRYLAWSPDGARIAIFGHNDAIVDDTIDMYYVATGENRQYAGTGAECCGMDDWSDLAWGPTGLLGMTVTPVDIETWESYPTVVSYPGFASRPNDRAPAPSPTGLRMAFTSVASGTAQVLVANVNGSTRRVVTTGYQPDWQPLP